MENTSFGRMTVFGNALRLLSLEISEAVTIEVSLRPNQGFGLDAFRSHNEKPLANIAVFQEK